MAKQSELDVFNRLRHSLDASGVSVVQLVPPGGQAPLSVSFRGHEGSRRTIFPDMIAYSEQNIFIGEIKPAYSKADAEKLQRLNSSPEGRLAIADLVARVARQPVLRSAPIHFILVHAGSFVSTSQGLRQVRFSNVQAVWVDANMIAEDLVFASLVSSSCI